MFNYSKLQHPEKQIHKKKNIGTCCERNGGWEHPLVMAKPKYCFPSKFVNNCFGNRVTSGSNRQANLLIRDEEV